MVYFALNKSRMKRIGRSIFIMMDSQVMSAEDCLVLPTYLPEVESSTCLLLSNTPSPTLTDPNHPLADTPKNLSIEDINDTAKTAEVNSQNGDIIIGDSSSSGSNSFIQDPVSAQLINNISMLDYQTLSKSGDVLSGQDHSLRQNGIITHGNMKLPSFVNWNWTLIRKFLLWVVVSSLVACSAAVIAMIITLPKSCNPETPWYQGKVFYEVFPANFEDSNKDGKGDLKGITRKIEYFKEWDISAIRLNFIFDASNFPENYSSLMRIDTSLGNITDFEELVATIHYYNMSIILDLPVISVSSKNNYGNGSGSSLIATDPMSQVLIYWAKQFQVDGFYLKGLEKYVDEPELVESLQTWKRAIGYNKIFMASYDAVKGATGSNIKILLSRIDLIDVGLNTTDRPSIVKAKIQEVISADALWSKPSNPWIHWNIGNVDEIRLGSKETSKVLSFYLLEFSLPGTVSIFYGDAKGIEGNLPRMERINEKMHITKSEPVSYLNVKSAISVRLNNPTLYLNGIYRDGEINTNTKIQSSESDIVIIERWYPRRASFVFVANLGDTDILKDLSSMYYGGKILASTNQSVVDEYLYFDNLVLKAGSAFIIKLDK